MTSHLPISSDQASPDANCGCSGTRLLSARSVTRAEVTRAQVTRMNALKFERYVKAVQRLRICWHQMKECSHDDT